MQTKLFRNQGGALNRNGRLGIVLCCLYLAAVFANSQSPAKDRSSVQEAQARGYWVDPSTELMWTARDNGKDVNWHQAIKYCRELSLAGYSDWSLPTIDQLQGIYDGSGFAAPPPQKGAIWALAGKAKGGLLLTGAREWSDSRVLDDRGHRTNFAWQFDFFSGKRWNIDPLGYHGSLRALCVRHSGG